MYQADLRLARAMMNLRLEEAQRQARAHNLPLRAGAGQQRWLSWHGCQLLCQLSHWLVVLGKRLERYSLPQRSLCHEEYKEASKCIR